MDERSYNSNRLFLKATIRRTWTQGFLPRHCPPRQFVTGLITIDSSTIPVQFFN